MLVTEAFASGAGEPGSVLVIGGGAAGMQAALNLAGLGVPVVLAEKNAHLGGQVMRLDKVYPTDHCAFCPVWSTARACYDSPLIKVLLRTEVTGLTTDGERTLAEFVARPSRIDPARCLFCGACSGVCPEKALVDRDPLMTWDPALPPAMRIDEARCSGCGACVDACPAGAIRLEQEAQTFTLAVADVVHAVGFAEPAPGEPEHAPEFGGGSHPDICTAMEFEAWHSESRDTGPLLTRSNGRAVHSVAFIQCAGARDQRHLPYCAAVCCLHGMKQARWLKRRQPELDVALFYTDLRAPGKAQETYIRAGEAEGVRLVRSRPGLILPTPDGKGIGVRYEHAANGRTVGERFDMAVLNGGLARCPLPGARPAHAEAPQKTALCGFCAEPTDVAGSVIQGAATAALIALRRASFGPSSGPSCGQGTAAARPAGEQA